MTAGGTDPATLEANKTLVRRLVEEVVNGGNVELMDELLHPDFVAHGVGRGPTGSDGMKGLIRAWRASFPDWHDTLEVIIAEGDRVVIMLTARGTHEGPLLDIPPTGEAVQWGLMEMLRVADGKIIEQWGYSDFAEVIGKLRSIAAAQAADKD